MKLTLTQGLLLALVATQIPVAIMNATPVWERFIARPFQNMREDERFKALLAKYCSQEAREADYAKNKLPETPKSAWHETPEGKKHLRMLEEYYGLETYDKCATRIWLEKYDDIKR